MIIPMFEVSMLPLATWLMSDGETLARIAQRLGQIKGNLLQTSLPFFGKSYRENMVE